jgi:hypothetical protein
VKFIFAVLYVSLIASAHSEILDFKVTSAKVSSPYNMGCASANLLFKNKGFYDDFKNEESVSVETNVLVEDYLRSSPLVEGIVLRGSEKEVSFRKDFEEGAGVVYSRYLGKGNQITAKFLKVDKSQRPTAIEFNYVLGSGVRGTFILGVEVVPFCEHKIVVERL